MRKISGLGIALVVVTTMLGLMATGAQAGSKHNTYEWCYGTGPERPCFGIVTVEKATKTWSYKAGEEEISGTWGKVKHSRTYEFKFTNASEEACEMRMAKAKRNFAGAEYCEGHEVEEAEWKGL